MEMIGTVLRCSCCNRPFQSSVPIRKIGSFIYCLACASDIENARRMD